MQWGVSPNAVVTTTYPMTIVQGMGAGTVAAIVLIIIAIIISGVLIFWLKKNEKLCFRPYTPVTQKPDPELGGNKPIIKEQPKQKAEPKQETEQNEPKDQNGENAPKE